MRPSLNISNPIEVDSRQMQRQVLKSTQPYEHNAVFVVDRADFISLALYEWHTPWNNDGPNKGQPVDYWKGATIRVLTGADTGKVYTVNESPHWRDKQWFNLTAQHNLKRGNAVAIHLPNAPDGYTYNERGNRVVEKAGRHVVYHDRWDEPTTGRRLFDPSGVWNFEMQLGPDTTCSEIYVSWYRGDSPKPFYKATFTLEEALGDWTVHNPLTTITVDREPDGTPLGAIEFKVDIDQGRIEFAHGGPKLERLGQSADNKTIFTDDALAILRRLSPDYLRCHFDHLGASVDNFLSDNPRPSSRHLDSWGLPQHHPSLPQFLDICDAVGAKPWVIGATHWTKEDYFRVWDYCYYKRNIRNLILECGNEAMMGAHKNGDPWWGVSLGRDSYPPVAEEIFSYLRSRTVGDGTSGDNTRLLVNGQWSDPSVTAKLAAEVPSAHGIALAPYWGTAGRSDWKAALVEQVATHASIWDAHEAAANGIPLYVYEMNDHCHEVPPNWTLDQLRDYHRDHAHKNITLLHFRENAKRGVPVQCLFTANQYMLANGVLLWGVVEDWRGKGVLRPAGDAMVELAQGDVPVEPEPPVVEPEPQEYEPDFGLLPIEERYPDEIQVDGYMVPARRID